MGAVFVEIIGVILNKVYLLHVECCCHFRLIWLYKTKDEKSSIFKQAGFAAEKQRFVAKKN